MAYVLTILFTFFLIEQRQHQMFLVFYASVLLAANEFWVYLVSAGLADNGKDFFEFYSLVQLLLIAASGFFLTGLYRIASIATLTLFSFYNMVINWSWGIVPITAYDDVTLGVVFTQMAIITFDEKRVGLTLAAVSFAAVITVLLSRFL